MQRVRLLGELGERFGAEYTYHNLRHPADAIKLLCINRPDFKDYLLSAEENGIGFRVIQGGEDMGYEDLLLPFGQNDLTIVPVVSGSNDEFTAILIGIGLIAISFLIPGAAAIGVLGLAKPIAVKGLVAGIGASLLLGGVAQALSPQPTIPNLTADRFGSGSRNRTGGPTNVTRGVDGVQSYAYTGAANTVGVGATVPLAYGKVLIGSHLLRSKVEVADESDPPLNSIKKSGPDTFLIGGEKLTTEFSDVSGAVVKRIYPDKTSFGSAGSITKTNFSNNNLQSLVAKPNTQSPFPTSTTATTTDALASKLQTLYGIPASVPTTPVEPVAPPISLAEAIANIKTTTPTVTNATTNILATGTNSSSATLSVPGYNPLRTNFNVAFNLANGLFNYAAGVNTTLVDAFITYEISVYRDSIDPVNLMAVDQASIQALLMPVQDNITWMHKMELPELSYTDAVVEVKIIDTDAYTPGMNGNTPISLNLLAIGFELT